jgi:hypothetical protein
MGRVYTFNCPRCEYRAHVSGGAEEGLHCRTQTIVCRDCRALHDVAVRVRVPEEKKQPLAKTKLLPVKENHLPPMLLFGKPPRVNWLELKPCCPTNASHRTEPWTAPGKCPRCGGFMERDVMVFRVWD